MWERSEGGSVMTYETLALEHWGQRSKGREEGWMGGEEDERLVHVG